MELDSSSLSPQSSAPSHSHLLGMQRLVGHLNWSTGQLWLSVVHKTTCWHSMTTTVNLRDSTSSCWRKPLPATMYAWVSVKCNKNKQTDMHVTKSWRAFHFSYSRSNSKLWLNSEKQVNFSQCIESVLQLKRADKSPRLSGYSGIDLTWERFDPGQIWHESTPV